MSHQPYPQQQPGWGAPPPRPPQPPKKTSVGKILGIVCGSIVGLFIFIGIVTTITGGSNSDSGGTTSSKPAAGAPDYKIVEQDADGNQRNVVVEVGSTKNLKAVFEAVTKGLSDEAGYYVQINCSTGGTKDVDNRLANGRYAVGRMGSATTGMKEGATEFSTNKGRSCPDKG